MDPAANAVMAISFFGAIAITVISIAAVWYKKLDVRRNSPLLQGDVVERLARIEAAVDAISIEVERISEAQRFSARLQAESMAAQLPPGRVPEARVITPH
ncbi:MAG TPA: hypothetical protein VJS39_03745 [Gemmatimonadaceae bacterium]|nr:hypothetical protein [Gemmatimonadaceae bacterium]